VQRLLNIGDVIEPSSAVGISYLVMAALLALGGMVMMRKRHAKEPS
jgi:hypothetical protein